MNISLPPELEKQLAEKVESGRYTDISAVVRAGLRLLFDAEEARSDRLDRLRADVALGLTQLDAGQCISGDSLLAEINERLDRRRQSSPATASLRQPAWTSSTLSSSWLSTI